MNISMFIFMLTSVTFFQNNNNLFANEDCYTAILSEDYGFIVKVINNTFIGDFSN